MIKSILKKGIRSLGFDIVSVGNLENEIRRREKQREEAKIERSRQFRALQDKSLSLPKTGEVFHVEREDLEAEANKLLRAVTTVLDIGCAFNPQPYIEAQVHICCEPFPEYMDRLMMEKQGESKFVFINSDIEKICEILPPKSVDSAFMIDVIEHVSKEDGQKALEKLKVIVRSQIILFTPLGYMDQEPSEDGIDPWGMGGTEWQKHRSGWTPEDFPPDEGWSMIVCDNFFPEDAYGNQLEEPVGAFWAVWNSPDRTILA